MARGCELTATGAQLLPHVRRLLAEADRFSEVLRTRHSIVRLGYAWAALGSHTAPLQRQWAALGGDVELALVRHNSPTAGLAEGLCDVAIVRNAVTDQRFDSVVVGLERRLVAFAADDPAWARRRQLSMAEIAQRPVLIDPRVGTTTRALWPVDAQPEQFVETPDVDAWLDAIEAGRGIGTTAEATAHHHARPGIAFRPIKDGPRIAVRLLWWKDQRVPGLAELVSAVTALYG